MIKFKQTHTQIIMRNENLKAGNDKNSHFS